MDDRVEELIKEIAVKHGIAVGRDDPVLILQTINHRLMRDTAKAQQEMLDQFKEEMEGIALRWGNDVKTKAEKILNASLAASRDGMSKVMQEGAREAADSVREEINTALGRVSVSIRAARWVSAWNVIASCITLLAAGVVLWVVLR
jgi:CHASE3 domain sensor protein